MFLIEDDYLINFFLAILFQICWWDTRTGGNPDGMVPMDQCHIDPVYKTIWLNAKQGNEFFTGSTDGTVSSKCFFTGN